MLRAPFLRIVNLAWIVAFASTMATTWDATGALLRSGTPPNKRQEQNKPEPATMPAPKRQPYFKLSEEQRRLFVTNARQIVLGETRKKVEELLGRPSSDTTLAAKGKRPKPRGRLVEYYVTKFDRNMVNERLDEWVLFVFGLDDRLQKVISEVPEVPDRP